MMNENFPEKNYLEILVTIISVSILFLFLFDAVILQNNQSGILIILSYIVIAFFSLLGYILILNTEFTAYIVRFSNTSAIYRNLLLLIIPIMLLLEFLMIYFIEPLRNSNILNISGEFLKYTIFVGVPLLLAGIYLTKTIQGSLILKLLIGNFIIFWIWWSIEFNNIFFSIADLVSGSKFFQLLAITLSAYIFLIVINFQVPRSFNRLLTFESLKIIAFWLVILFILILPAGLLTSFLVFDIGSFSGHLVENLLLIPLTFIGIFLLIAIIEEFLFRGLIYQWVLNQVEELNEKFQEYIIVTFFIFLTLIFVVTPFLGLAEPIDTGLVKDIPLEIIYPFIGIIYLVIGLTFYYKTKKLTLTMLLWSSMIFGWAHFEDWRYIIFATIAGIGYCDTYRRTNNIFASTVVHASVNTIWAIFLT